MNPECNPAATAVVIAVSTRRPREADRAGDRSHLLASPALNVEPSLLVRNASF